MAVSIVYFFKESIVWYVTTSLLHFDPTPNKRLIKIQRAQVILNTR